VVSGELKAAYTPGSGERLLIQVRCGNAARKTGRRGGSADRCLLASVYDTADGLQLAAAIRLTPSEMQGADVTLPRQAIPLEDPEKPWTSLSAGCPHGSWPVERIPLVAAALEARGNWRRAAPFIAGSPA
jgi:hypothetical protein